MNSYDLTIEFTADQMAEIRQYVSDALSESENGYRGLLRKYMRRVIEIQGTSYICSHVKPDGFTEKEVDTLQDIEREIWKPC